MEKLGHLVVYFEIMYTKSESKSFCVGVGGRQKLRSVHIEAL